TANDFKYLENKATIYYVYGDNDEYIHGDFLISEKDKIKHIFSNVNYIEFEGKHEFKKEIIESIIN
ncbi:MAG: esterase, partial [Flavobacteriaceae bacterium]|nr:esterase [Flavobacteriaceae bacterium]